ncbi:MAG: hypothetical protein LC750_00615 [Actinobacteria bacterium]|nr:hypothetical protein [Actinomycetota bacterium]
MTDPIRLPVVRRGDDHPNNTTIAVTFGPLYWKRLCALAKAWGLEPHEAAEMMICDQLKPPRVRRR